jgi:hypothetical protein
MAKPIQFILTAEEMAHFLAWRAQVEADTGTPVKGVAFSFLVGKQGEMQLIVRPSTEPDFKLPNIARTDGTYDTFAPHEEVLATYDDFGFASTTILWRDVGIRFWLCEGTMLGRGETPRCYVECLDELHRPFVPFRVSDQPGVLEEDALFTVFPYTPLPPAVSHQIEAFIRTNVTALLQHWRGETDSPTLLHALQPRGGPPRRRSVPGVGRDKPHRWRLSGDRAALGKTVRKLQQYRIIRVKVPVKQWFDHNAPESI